MKEQIEKYFTGELERNERIALLKKVETDEASRNEFTRYQNTHALLSLSDEVVDPADTRKGYRRFYAQVKRRSIYHSIRKTAGYAAAMILLALAVHFYHVYRNPQSPLLTAETSLFVPAGQRVSVTLSDGTVVWLNAQSRLTYPAIFAGDQRKVTLEGEGYFEVAPNKEQPFIVSAGEIDMKVLGTSFNVYNYPQEDFSRISLIEGSLQVYGPSSHSKQVILSPNEEVTIRNGQMTVAPIPNEDYFLWKSGIYSFTSEEFGVILKKLELYYDIEIIVNDPSMLKWRYTVKFRQRDSINEIMRLLQKIHPFRMQKDEENNRIVIDK